MNIYLDNAATTAMLPEVIKAVHESMQTVYGNPSSTHVYGRKAKAVVERARKNIGSYFNISGNEIVFTAGGSEADNLILRNAVTKLGVKKIISSKQEHHAVLHSLEALEKEFDVEVHYIESLPNGGIDYEELAIVLESTDSIDSKKTLVSLMHVNNETGRILDLQKVSDLCEKNHALFHSDTVQGVGHFDIDLQKTPIDFITASAHKFHGPKGVGFAYFKKGISVNPILHGGDQERGARAGTENIHGIVGLEIALQEAYENLEKDISFIQGLKSYFIQELKRTIPDIQFNSKSDDVNESSYIILNVRFPDEYPMMLVKLDLKGISASGGSACQSGSNKGSHVLQAILDETTVLYSSIRFSFSKNNTKEEIDYVIGVLGEIVK